MCEPVPMTSEQMKEILAPSKPHMTIEQMKEMLTPGRAPNADSGEPTVLTSALAYASMGWHVLPLKARSKVSLVRWKAGATTDPAVIRSWWEKWPDAGVAIAVEPSKLVAVDGDDPSVEADLDLPETLTAATGRGQHFYYQAPEGVALKSWSGPGFDVKATGYVVAPPSIHPTGVRYK